MERKFNKCSDFEEMLMWTSYRYCIGRHTYVVTMAQEIAQHYYNKLSDNRKRFTANDIRNEIAMSLRCLPFTFNISRWSSEDEYNPLKTLFTFFNNENITSLEELAQYGNVDYDAHEKKFSCSKRESTYKSYIGIMDIDDLIPWETLASLFDIDNHKTLVLENGTEVKAFKKWTRQTVPVENKMDMSSNFTYYTQKEFGWEEIWVSVDDASNGKWNTFIPNDIIKEIKD